MVMVGNGHQAKEAVLYVAYFKIISAIGVERRDKGSALFHITNFKLEFVLVINKYLSVR